MTLLFVVAIAAFMFPLCDVFTIIGLPSGPCLLMLTIGALLAAICTVSGWMALVSTCPQKSPKYPQKSSRYPPKKPKQLRKGPCLFMHTIGALLAAICTVSGWIALVSTCPQHVRKRALDIRKRALDIRKRALEYMSATEP